ncbi:hypothetical protein [Candidatus Oscillochloris fontis]|uniref:hypothetical protein n=1 Tax=Candidatus Oscillochloris fontis TaxID=2496868 RepID=UPI00101DB177|nr:hypothetical protein [Candidatus Oscillochloris fontis]
MKTIQIMEPESLLLTLLNQARQEDLRLQLADGQEFILTAIDHFDVEIIQTRKNATLMALLDERAQEPATIDLASLKAELGIDECPPPPLP